MPSLALAKWPTDAVHQVPDVESAWFLDPADSTLYAQGDGVLRLISGWTCTQDPTHAGVLLCPPPQDPASYQEHLLGQIVGMDRFTSLYRFSPFWTRPRVGTHVREVRHETLWLLAKTSSARYILLVPLLGQRTRFALRSQQDDLMLVAETGDSALACEAGAALYVAVGEDPYALQVIAARAVSAHIGAGRLRAEKPLPDHLNGLGWCTWDAFYKDVSPDKVLQGLQSLAQAGAAPRWMILDDGWQSWTRHPGGEDRLNSFAPNARFGGDLAPLVQAVKQRYGLTHFFVWHALLGYWGGLCEQAFADYGVRSVPRTFGPGVLAQDPRWNVHPWGAQQGVPAAAHWQTFYEDWHAQLAQQGVDGVKVDAQAMLESVSAGQGGRVALARTSRQALEDAVGTHFAGRLINCMSCGSEGAYLSHDSVLMRTSDDFFPSRPDSHGLHLFANALASLWWGEFMLPDWDMFQSAHSHGAFHAAARAVSGGPVYVSDGIGQHDAAVLRALVLSDGSVLRADDPGRPSPEVLMRDPTTEPVLLKVFNRNRDCGVLGLFHASQCPERIAAAVSLADVPVLSAQRAYVAWSRRSDRLWHSDHQPAETVTLAPAEWDMVSFAPIEQGLAVIGLTDKFNSTGAIVSSRWTGSICEVRMRDGGPWLAWSQHPPVSMHADEEPLSFEHDATTGRLACVLPAGGQKTLRLTW